MSIDDVFAELVSRTIGEILRELFVTQNNACDATNLRFPENVDVILTKPGKSILSVPHFLNSVSQINS